MKPRTCKCGQMPVTAKQTGTGFYICTCVNSKCDVYYEPGANRPRPTRHEAIRMWNLYAGSFTAKVLERYPKGAPWQR